MINKVTLNLYDHAVSKARCEANGPALGKQRNAADGEAVQTHRAGRTATRVRRLSASIAPLWPHLSNAALAAVLPAERYLICQAAH